MARPPARWPRGSPSCSWARRTTLDQDAFERKLYVIRRAVEHEDLEELAIPSFSSRTMVLKGMLTAPQLPRYFPDLRDERVVSRLALVHSRFSTNTFPSWELAHPYRMLAHNGEINTLRGNRNWMRARELQLASDLFGEDIQKIHPLLRDDISDSASLDGLMELLVLGGRSAAHAISMLIPEAHQGRPGAAAGGARLLRLPLLARRALGRPGGRGLQRRPRDRRDARPQRPAARALARDEGRLGGVRLRDRRARGAGRRDRLQGPAAARQALPRRPRARRRSCPTARSSSSSRRRRPYGRWLEERVVHIEDLPEKTPRVPRVEPLRAKQLAFGWTEEDLRVTLVPMARDATEPTGSMGNDAALAVLSDMRPPLFSYFKQLFAQVTNPAIDPIRESIVMSLEAVIGPEINLLGETPDHCHQLVMPQPLLRSTELEKLRQVDHSVFEARTIDMTWPAAQGAQGMEQRLEEICDGGLRADRARREHHHPLRPQPRRRARPDARAARHRGRAQPPRPRGHAPAKIGLIVETGQAKEIHHVACLIGYGAAAGEPVRDVRVALRAPSRGPPARGHGSRRGGAAATSRRSARAS